MKKVKRVVLGEGKLRWELGEGHYIRMPLLYGEDVFVGYRILRAHEGARVRLVAEVLEDR